MTDEFGKKIKESARLLALEYLTCHTYNIVLRMSGADEGLIRKMEEDGLLTIGLQPLVTRDPALSDHVSAEMRDALADLLADAREMREAARKQ